MMIRFLQLFCFAGLAGCGTIAVNEAVSSKPLETLPQTAPEKTVRFPGGNFGGIALKDGLAVVCAGWSREDGVAVFDVRDPKKPQFLARFPAKGYCCAEPVFFGSRCYVPNGFSGMVIDISDRKHPKLAGYLNPQFPKNGCTRFWVEEDKLYFAAHDGNYQVQADGLSFVKTDKVAPKRGKKANAVTESGVTVELKNSAVVVGTTELPFAYCLSAVAAKDGEVFVYAPQHSGIGAQLLPLPAKADGLSLFAGRVVTAAVSRGNGFQAMGMQTACNVTRVGDLFFVDDGIVRQGRRGTWETLQNRTRAVANASVDGTRIALAQCSRCRILDFADPVNVKVRDVTPTAELPLHITGCHLRGNELFLAYTLVEQKGQDFIYKFPTKGYVCAIDLRDPEKVLSTVEIPACIALDRVGDFLYVSCRKGDFAVIDASDPSELTVKAVRRDLLDDDGFKVKTFGGRTFALNGHRVAELDTTVSSVPQIRRLYARGDGTEAPSYDDFTVDGNRLYALAHASVDVFVLDDTKRTVPVRNDCGTNGILKAPLEAADVAVFAGHRPNPKPPAGISFAAGRFGNSFGAYVFDWAKLPDGRYAVAYGEAGVVICDAKGSYVAELPRDSSGWVALFASEVLCKDGAVYVKEGDGKAYHLPLSGGLFR